MIENKLKILLLGMLSTNISYSDNNIDIKNNNVNINNSTDQENNKKRVFTVGDDLGNSRNDVTVCRACLLHGEKTHTNNNVVVVPQQQQHYYLLGSTGSLTLNYGKLIDVDSQNLLPILGNYDLKAFNALNSESQEKIFNTIINNIPRSFFRSCISQFGKILFNIFLMNAPVLIYTLYTNHEDFLDIEWSITSTHLSENPILYTYMLLYEENKPITNTTSKQDLLCFVNMLDGGFYHKKHLNSKDPVTSHMGVFTEFYTWFGIVSHITPHFFSYNSMFKLSNFGKNNLPTILSYIWKFYALSESQIYSNINHPQNSTWNDDKKAALYKLLGNFLSIFLVRNVIWYWFYCGTLNKINNINNIISQNQGQYLNSQIVFSTELNQHNAQQQIMQAIIS